MKKISTSICLGLGDNIVARIIFDTVKHQYSEIRISHDKEVIKNHKNGDAGYLRFLNEIGSLLFTEPPFYFDNIAYPPIHTFNTIKTLYVPQKPNLQNLLCKGTPLNLNEEYIIITTKIRGISKKKFLPMSILLWRVLNQLSTKYKIVIVGERVVETNVEYGHNSDIIYCIYDHIFANLPNDRIVDLTIPALGQAAPQLFKIQQDALIMQQAKFIITLGLGGNVWLAAASGNQIIGFRDVDDRDHSADLLFHPNFSTVKMFKNWQEFINKLREFL